MDPNSWRFAAWPMVPNIECWLGSFVIFQGIRTTIGKKPIVCDFSGRGGGVLTSCPPLWTRAVDQTAVKCSPDTDSQELSMNIMFGFYNYVKINLVSLLEQTLYG